MDKIKIILKKMIPVIDDDELDILCDKLGIDKNTVLEDIADDVKGGARQVSTLETISDRQDEGESLGKILDEFQEAEINNPESLQEKLHPGKELYSGGKLSGEKDAITALAAGKDSLEDYADLSKAEARYDARDKMMADRADNGEKYRYIREELQDSIYPDAAQLHKHLHGDDAELYTEEEKTALGSIADAIRDRWQ